MSDTGNGIPKEEQEKVFERFYRLSPSYKNEHHGHGVGLHIAERYVALLGGQINLESKVGVGTVFSFSIPLLIGEEKTLCLKSLDADGLVGKSSQISPAEVVAIEHNAIVPHVLLVEDSIIALKVLENLVAQSGCRFTSASTGEEGLILAKTHQFDFIVSDIGLPGISGNEMTQLIRQWEKNNIPKISPIPIYGLSGHGLQTISKESLVAGMNQVFAKPMQQRAFKKILQSIQIQDKKLLAAPVLKLQNEEREFSLELDEHFSLKKYPLINKQEAIKNIGDETIVRALFIRLIQEELPDGLLEIKQAYAKSNWSAIDFLAHKMKGGAMYSCTTRLKWACQYLERYYKTGHTDNLEALYHQLVQVIEDTILAIQQLE
ncbi:MAG: response regulator [Legionella longbeachae]|nr:response regulator [Legionella longbeachae]